MPSEYFPILHPLLFIYILPQFSKMIKCRQNILHNLHCSIMQSGFGLQYSSLSDRACEKGSVDCVDCVAVLVLTRVLPSHFFYFFPSPYFARNGIKAGYCNTTQTPNKTKCQNVPSVIFIFFLVTLVVSALDQIL